MEKRKGIKWFSYYFSEKRAGTTSDIQKEGGTEARYRLAGSPWVVHRQSQRVRKLWVHEPK